MKNNLVTIAIPAYKADFIQDAIYSALNQTYPNIELVVVDDNSPENIEEIVQKINDSRIRYYRNEKNIGAEDPSQNWNKCLQYARGDFFALLCDDDTYESNFIEEMLKLKLEFPNVAVFRARAKVIDENNNIVNWYPSLPKFETCIDYMYQKMSGYRRQTISEFFYDTQYIKKLGGYVNTPRAWTADALSIYTFAWENGIASTQSILVNFRNSGKNISSTNKDALKKREALFLYQQKINQFIHQINDSNYKKILQKALYYSMFCEIKGLCSQASFFNIFRILIKGGFPRSWILFIIPEKIGVIWQRFAKK